MSLNVAEAKAALNLGSVAPPPVTTPGAGPLPFPPAPGAPATTPAETKLPNGGKWARYVGKLGTAMTVTVSAASIRKGGHEPNEPDEADCRLLEDALEEGLRLQYGDRNVPWWLGAALAASGVYAGMRIGAPKSKEETPMVQDATPQGPQVKASPKGNEPEKVKPIITGIFPKRIGT